MQVEIENVVKAPAIKKKEVNGVLKMEVVVAWILLDSEKEEMKRIGWCSRRTDTLKLKSKKGNGKR